MKKSTQTFWCEQAEFIGGAERFSLDFFQNLTPTEHRLLRMTVVGGQHPDFQAALPESINVAPFVFPAVNGGPIAKSLAVIKLWWQARLLRRLVTPGTTPQWVTNTPRAHFILFLAKVCWRLPGRWTSIFHDFTTRPAWLLASIVRRSDIVIANSMPTRRYVREVLPADTHHKIRLIENGVDFSQVPAETPAPKQVQSLLHLGRIDPRKGQLYTAEAADLLLERNPDLRFTIVGSSVEQDPRTTDYDQALQTFKKRRNLTNLSCKTAVSDPFKEIAQHDAMLVCSTEPETFGRIATEGLACNKLVLAFDQTGPREILTGYYQWLIKQGHLPADAPNRLLVEANNSMSLAEAVAYFADNPKEIAAYASHGRAYIEKNFNLTETKKRLVEVLVS